MGGLDNKHLVFTVLEARESKIKTLAESVSGKGLFLRSYVAIFLTMTLHGRKRVKVLSEVLYIRTLIPFMRAPFL